MKPVLTLLLAIALALPAAAQQDEKRKLVQEVIDAIGAKALTQALFESNLPNIADEPFPPELNEEDRPAWEQEKRNRQRDLTAYREAVFARLDYARFANEIYAPIFERSFSTEELRELSALLKTPIGQKTGRILPQLVAANTTKGAALLERETRRVQAELEQADRKAHPWKATVAEMRDLATALDSYAIAHSKYPSSDELKQALEGQYITRVPEKDVWGQSLLYVSNGESYRLVSAGADKQFSNDADKFETDPRPRTSDDPGADIIVQSGMILQTPSERAPAQ